MLCASYFAVACGLYLVWPSRWNVIAHFGLAFAVIAYLFPVAVLHVQDSYPSSVVESYTLAMVVGALAYIGGLLYALLVLSPAPSRRLARVLARVDSTHQDQYERRTLVAITLAAALLAGSFLYMGFTPMFAADPLLAKFFRGAYKERYDPVSPFYRLAMAVLPTLLGIGAWISFRGRHRASAALLVVSGTALVLLTLSRNSIAHSLILLVVAALVWKGRTVLGMLVAVASYAAGSLLYYFLRVLGLSVGGASGTRGFVAEMAATVPDVTDALSFWQAWQNLGEPHTFGRTMVGGLVPGNNAWNPSVWSVTFGSPFVDVTQVSSGGLRLPMQVWGAVNAGMVGVVVIGLLAGVAAGYVTIKVRALLPARSLISTLTALVLLDLLVNGVIGNFYVLSYFDALQLAVVLWVIYPLSRDERSPRSGPGALRGCQGVVSSSSRISGGLGSSRRSGTGFISRSGDRPTVGLGRAADGEVR